MARTNRYICKTCGDAFERCVKCLITKPDYDAENFCTNEHADIYAVLSKHGCNLITADEALAELKAYNIDEIKFAKEIATHIKRIKSEATKAATPAPKADVKPTTTVNRSDKKQ